MDDDSWVEADGRPFTNPDPLDAGKARTDPIDVPTEPSAGEPVVTQGSGRPDGLIDGKHGYSEAYPDSHQSG